MTISIALVVLAAAQVAAPQQPLELTCFGGGSANKPTTATANTNSTFSGLAGGTLVSGSGFDSTTIVIPRKQDFSDQVDGRLFNGDERIRMPPTMLPMFRGGNAGWFKLKNVTADARSFAPRQL